MLAKFNRRSYETAKALILSDLSKVDGKTIGFEFGTEIGRKAATAALAEHVYDNPDEVAPRPNTLTSG